MLGCTCSRFQQGRLTAGEGSQTHGTVVHALYTYLAGNSLSQVFTGLISDLHRERARPVLGLITLQTADKHRTVLIPVLRAMSLQLHTPTLKLKQ
mmetsp:Transcript_71801/g.131036  ORF Transcript_71801/g.131036 Transcript_71801/m.131036 type:complete len:95 (+) Transcript_71801:52-336(+)